MDLVIDGKILKNNEIIDVNIGIENGMIKALKKSITGEKIKRISGLIIPAMVDLHVHFRDPGYTYKEDFESGSLSALYGGVSFVMDMPNTYPVTDSVEKFEQKKRIVSAKSYIDFGLAAAVTETYNELLVSRATAFKLYMAKTTGIDIHNLDQLLSTTKKIIKKKKVFVHAELESNFITTGAKNIKEYSFTRPESSEINAIRLLANNNIHNLHITHVSSPDSIPYTIGAQYTTDVTPHHLFLNTSMNLNAFGKTNPPIRPRHVIRELWTLVISGNVDFIASDHAPHTIEEKQEFEHAPAGVPEVETTLPLFLQEYKKGTISLQKMIEILATRPAEFLNLKKGKIKVGYDADLIAFRLSDSKKITGEKLHYKCGWTPYEKFNAIFPHTVLIRGVLKIDEYQLVDSPGTGKFYN